MILDSSSLWFAETNTWVLANEAGGAAVVIDAPPDPDGVVELLARHDLTCVALVVTHGHIDHFGGAGGVARATGAVTYVHPDDDYLTLNPIEQMRVLFGVVPAGDYRPPERRLDLADGDRLHLAGLSLDVRHTPGHTPGHCCFLLESEGWLFSGDQLFAGSIGRTDLPGGDYQTLMRSMTDRVLDLEDATRVLPGHGPETTVGRERRSNPFILGLA